MIVIVSALFLKTRPVGRSKIWTSGFFPTSWHKATIIPLPKPGKDNNDPNNYRPIALTSGICKTMERMVNDRLVWFLEKEQILSQSQSGFRKRRSTVDQLIKLETLVRESFIQGHQVWPSFLTLRKLMIPLGNMVL